MSEIAATPILKSGTDPADSDRMPLKVREIQGVDQVSCRTCKAGVQIRQIRDRFWSDSTRIPHKLPVNGASSCVTQENQRRTNTHEINYLRAICRDGG